MYALMIAVLNKDGTVGNWKAEREFTIDYFKEIKIVFHLIYSILSKESVDELVKGEFFRS